MWNIISNKWLNKNDIDNDSTETYKESLLKFQYIIPVDTTIEEQSNIILTESSARDKGPIDSSIKLWPHQEAMLHRIREIENNGFLCKTENTEAAIGRYMDKKQASKSYDVCLGVMNDPPGSGKTYAILTHIITDKLNKGASIIIVPQNIYAQWRQSIELIFKNCLSLCKFSKSYSDVMDVYGNPDKINAYKVILLQDTFAEPYLKVLNDNNIGLCRIIIDEIDIMDKFICSSVKTKFVWLMSASYKDQKRLGPYHITNHKKVICKCDGEFVKKSVNIPEALSRVIECDDDHIQIFKDILEPKKMKELHSGDHSMLNRIMNISGYITPLIYKDSVKKYSEYLLKKSDILEESELELKNMIVKDEEDSDRTKKERNILMSKINLLKRYRENSETLIARLETLPSIDTLNYKEKYLQGEIVQSILNNKDSKWLFFNDNGNVLIKYQELLLANNIKSLMLDGGNQNSVEKTLKEYKDGNINVLLLNSMIEGAGMNLENTTHLLFMHKTEEKFIEQVVGRAQRYGRTQPLNIIMLFNKHE